MQQNETESKSLLICPIGILPQEQMTERNLEEFRNNSKVIWFLRNSDTRPLWFSCLLKGSSAFLFLYFSVIYFCNGYPDHWIQQPILKLPILNFHEFSNKSDWFFFQVLMFKAGHLAGELQILITRPFKLKSYKKSTSIQCHRGNVKIIMITMGLSQTL